MVLDRVISPASQQLRNLGPSVAQHLMRQKEYPLFLVAPVLFLDLGVEMVVPAFSALLADATWQVLCDEGPFLGAVLLD
jgi:hypothetical protein